MDLVDIFNGHYEGIEGCPDEWYGANRVRLFPYKDGKKASLTIFSGKPYGEVILLDKEGLLKLAEQATKLANNIATPKKESSLEDRLKQVEAKLNGLIYDFYGKP